MRRDSGLPGQCWPTSRPRRGSTSRGSPKPCRSFWQTNGRLSTANAAGPRCRSTSTTPNPAGSISTLSGVSGRSLITRASPSPAARQVAGGGCPREPAASRQEAPPAPSPRRTGAAPARGQDSDRHRGPAERWGPTDGHSRLRLWLRGRGAGYSRRHRDAHLEEAFRAHDAATDEGHRRTERALPHPLRPERGSGYGLSHPLLEDRPLAQPQSPVVPPCHGLSETTGLPAGMVASCAKAILRLPDLMTHLGPARCSTLELWGLSCSLVEQKHMTRWRRWATDYCGVDRLKRSRAWGARRSIGSCSTETSRRRPVERERHHGLVGVATASEKPVRPAQRSLDNAWLTAGASNADRRSESRG